MSVSGASTTPGGVSPFWEVLNSIEDTVVEDASARDPAKRSMQFEDEDRTTKSPRSASPAPSSLPAVANLAYDPPGDQSVRGLRGCDPAGAVNEGTPLLVGANDRELSGGGGESVCELALDSAKATRFDRAPAPAR